MRSLHFSGLAALLIVFSSLVGRTVAVDTPPPTTGAADAGQLFARTNLVAWCIVPFDAKKRGPKERAEMLRRLGIGKLAYDWRDKHVPFFEEEILETKRNGIENESRATSATREAAMQTFNLFLTFQGDLP